MLFFDNTPTVKSTSFSPSLFSLRSRFWIDQFRALWKVGRAPFKGWPKIWAPSCRPFTFLRLKSWHPEYFFQTANTFWGILGRKYVSYKWQLKLILANETKLSKFVFHGRITDITSYQIYRTSSAPSTIAG